jgi:urocanate hydratase
MLRKGYIPNAGAGLPPGIPSFGEGAARLGLAISEGIQRCIAQMLWNDSALGGFRHDAGYETAREHVETIGLHVL